MDKKEILDQVAIFQKNTMTDHLGIEITDLDKCSIAGKMPVNDRTKQPYGLLHGGASAAFAETLGSIGAGMQIDYNKKSVVGIELNVSHLQSISNGWVYGKAEAVRVGKKIQVWNIDIYDDKNTLICKSRLTLAVINNNDRKKHS
ncbi:MAG: hotdog fold thioesterase [Candidatus Marinimicrobia bacterium]|nr:hotdog fold thioesterase [Candidatus Neomarinimicrobiota bacterium]